MRSKVVLAAVIVTCVTGAPLAGAQQTAPPEPPPSGPPPPPPDYGNAPGYGPPPSGPPRAQGSVEVRFEPDAPNLSLFSASGAAPVERFRRFHYGWWGGYRYDYGWAPLYSPVCDQACATRLTPGPYQLALAKNNGRVVPAYGPLVINGPSLIRGSYSDHSGLRATGWVIGVAGLVGGIVMIVASANDEFVCDPDGFCHHHETADTPLLVGGIGVLVVSSIVGGVLASQHDEAHLSIEPLRLSSFGSLRESLAATGAEAHPEGAALALHF
ncbi:MAG TPA: hypothetical protein VGF76_10670 [Polyangiaceae bacterium]